MSKAGVARHHTNGKLPPSLTLADITVVQPRGDDVEKTTGAELLRLMDLIQGVCPNWRAALTSMDGIVFEMKQFSRLISLASENEDQSDAENALSAISQALHWFAARIEGAQGSDDDLMQAARRYGIEIAPQRGRNKT